MHELRCPHVCLPAAFSLSALEEMLARSKRGERLLYGTAVRAQPGRLWQRRPRRQLRQPLPDNPPTLSWSQMNSLRPSWTGRCRTPRSMRLRRRPTRND